MQSRSPRAPPSRLRRGAAFSVPTRPNEGIGSGRAAPEAFKKTIVLPPVEEWEAKAVGSKPAPIATGRVRLLAPSRGRGSRPLVAIRFPPVLVTAAGSRTNTVFGPNMVGTG